MNLEDLTEFEGLSPTDQARLTELLDDYIRGLEQGQPPDREQLIARHPDLASRLGPYLESLDFLQDAAAGFCAAPPMSGDSAEDAASAARQIGDFRIIREVGRGGMGVVYEAWQVSLDRRVALKVLPFAALLDARQIARFRNEARAAAQLQHPNIVPVFAVGTERGAHYYAMQFVEGQPLDAAIAEMRSAARNEPCRADVETARPWLTAFTESQGSRAYFRTVARLGVQAAEALHAAHEFGIVHRDVKPSNLLLDIEGKLWIADFGLARCRWESNLTQTGDVVGTMRYMSPEQMRGQTHLIDHRTDVYSLGVTLYELLTLRHAVRGSDAAAICRELERQEPYPLRLLNDKIPIDLETIIQKAIAKSREDRYETARELAHDLQRFLDGQPTRARRPTPLERSAKLLRRHKHAAATAAGVLAMAFLGLVMSTLLLAREKGRTELALAEARQNFRQYRSQLALSRHHLAVLQNESGDLEGAEQSFLQAKELQREIVRESPDDEQSLRSLAATLNNLGFLYARTDSAKAGEYRKEAIAVHEQLLASAPGNRAYQRDLAQAYGNAGALTKSLTLLEKLHASQPDDAATARELAIAHNNLGMAQEQRESFDAAAQSFQRALAILAPLATREAAAADLSSLGGIHNNLGMVQEKQGQWDAAADSFTRAVESQRLAHREMPGVPRFREFLSKHYYNQARVLRRVQRWPEAIDASVARWDLWRGDARRLATVAEELALVAAQAQATADVSAERAVKLTMAVLREVHDLGLPPGPTIRNSTALMSLRGHPEMSIWLAGAGNVPSQGDGKQGVP